MKRPHPLGMKMLRDLWRLRAQGGAVVLLLGLGIGILAGSLGMHLSLGQARDDYYRESLFAHAQVNLVRAPRRLVAAVARLPGVQAVDARAAAPVVLDLPEATEPVTGRLLSLDDPFTTPVNRPWLVSGRWPRPDARDEVVVNQAFMDARGLQVGASLPATIRGGRERLRVVGIANSPEFVFVNPPGDLFPQPERYAVLWMPRRALERAADMDGAFNDLVIRLAPGQRIEALEPALEALLGRYGAQRPRGRERIASARFLDQELDQLRTMALVIPPAFLAVAAFLLNVSLTRLVEAERSNIGLLKAFGFHPGEVAVAYLGLAAALAGLGTMLGLVLGQMLGEWMATLYLEFYKLPALPFEMGLGAALAGAGTGVLAAVAGSLSAVRRVLALAPAQALAPAPPPSFRHGHGLAESAARHFDALTRVVLRRILGFPRRSLTTIAGIACALVLLVLSQSFPVGVQRLLDISFSLSRRQDVSLSLAEAQGRDAFRALARLPGVERAEASRAVEAIFHANGRRTDEALIGLPEKPMLERIVDAEGRAWPAREDGLLLSRSLAGKLGAQPGDRVRVELVGGQRRSFDLPVVGVVPVTIGSSAYIGLEALNRAAGEPQRVNGAHLRLDGSRYRAFNDAVRESPAIVGVSYVGLARASMQKIFDEGAGAMSGIFIAFAVLMAVGVAYATASVTLAEQRHDLATLQVMGYGRLEVSYVLIAEIVLLSLAALPVGLFAGHWFSVAFMQAMATDMFTFPSVFQPATFGTATLIIAAAIGAAVLVVRREVDRINLVESLKSRE